MLFNSQIKKKNILRKANAHKDVKITEKWRKIKNLIKENKIELLKQMMQFCLGYWGTFRSIDKNWENLNQTSFCMFGAHGEFGVELHYSITVRASCLFKVYEFSSFQCLSRNLCAIKVMLIMINSVLLSHSYCKKSVYSEYPKWTHENATNHESDKFIERTLFGGICVFRMSASLHW